MIEAERKLPISMEADICVRRYTFASICGRSTRVMLKTSPLYNVQWRIITPMKIVEKKQLDVVRVNAELMLSPKEALLAERWRMKWITVVLRMSHGAHNAVIQRIIAPSQLHIEMITANVARVRRFNTVRWVAPIQVGVRRIICTSFFIEIICAIISFEKKKAKVDLICRI
uniref:AN1-type domain-containing protein n=1 Tax=Parascaris univalens TaxID=6257 RepID=A0A915BYR1_PARUN